MRKGSRSVKATEKKNELLRLARAEACKPNVQSVLGSALRNYMNEGGPAYDAAFSALIRQVCPCWFVGAAARRKEMLLELAGDGVDEPYIGLLNTLRSYTTSSSHNYDAEFDVKIRALRPDWFVRTKTRAQKRADKKKELLLELAKVGVERPGLDNMIGRALDDYTYRSRNSYDAEFDVKIRALRPDWWPGVNGLPYRRCAGSTKKKRELLELARSGARKPKSLTELGRAFGSYSRPKSPCFDTFFVDVIRAVRPEWLRYYYRG